MNRSDLAAKVSRRSRTTRPVVDQVIDLILEEMTTALASGDTVAIKNFGKFSTRERKETVRKNPRTGEEIKVPPKRAILFHPSPNFKNGVQ